MERDNGFGILTTHRSKAEVPYIEWAVDVPAKIMKSFSKDLRKAHQLGISASTAILLLQRVKHVATPGAERTPGSNAPPEREASPKDTKSVLDKLTPGQWDFLTTKLSAMGYV